MNRQAPWFIWGAVVCFYGIEYIQKVMPSVVANNLLQTLGSVKYLTWIMSAYFYAYAAAQIPAGLLLDRYNSRWILTIACMVMSLGAMCFASTHSVVNMLIGRILVGLSSSFAFIGVLKVASIVFPKERYPLVVGLTNTVGVVGAIIGQAPLMRLSEAFGWRQSIMLLSWLGFLIALIIAKILPIRKKRTHRPIGYHFSILKNRTLWLQAIYASTLVLPIIVVGELWAVVFFQSAYHMSAFNASLCNTYLFLGIAIGGPVNGLLSSVFGYRKVLGYQHGTLCVLLWLMVTKTLSLLLLPLIWWWVGFSASSMLLIFSMQQHLKQPSALVSAAINMIIMFVGGAAQHAMGYYIDWLMLQHTLSDAVCCAMLLLPVIPSVSLLFLFKL
jgi:MFS family permease